MSNYTFSVKDKENTTLYPKKIQLICMEIVVTEWTQNINEATTWTEQECAQIAAYQYKGTTIVEVNQ